jgi:thiamine biosynthesis lipoprotein
VDLGGLGKGIALRRAAAAVSRRLGGEPFLLDAGGDIATGGWAFTWSIGIEDPAGGAEPLATLSIPGGWAVATSSTRLARRDGGGGGEGVHHLVDPGTGRPGGTGLAAVTVAWRDAAWAEVWSKALFIEGPAGIGPAARARGLAAWWVDAEGALSMTPAARQVTTWVRAEAGLSPP